MPRTRAARRRSHPRRVGPRMMARASRCRRARARRPTATRNDESGLEREGVVNDAEGDARDEEQRRWKHRRRGMATAQRDRDRGGRADEPEQERRNQERLVRTDRNGDRDELLPRQRGARSPGRARPGRGRQHDERRPPDRVSRPGRRSRGRPPTTATTTAHAGQSRRVPTTPIADPTRIAAPAAMKNAGLS